MQSNLCLHVSSWPVLVHTFLFYNSYIFFFYFFFFQAEDGIRDGTVTGVQTCALPIYCKRRRCAPADATRAPFRESYEAHRSACHHRGDPRRAHELQQLSPSTMAG